MDELYKKLIKEPARGIHSEIHALAKDISEYCGEPKKFALYLGVIKRIGKDRAYQIFSEIKQSKNIKSPAKMFMYLSKNMILEIQKGQNNPILRKKSLKVKKIDNDVRKLAKGMIKIMNKNNGIGLSACQVGENIRMFVIPKELSEKQIFVNPEIIKISKKTDVIEEGCLSVPGVYLPIKRATSLKIKALDENNKEFNLKTKDLLSRVIQHEIDHLNGILITDHYE